VLVWGGTPGTFDNYFGDGAAYDPAADRWRRLPSMSARFTNGGVWTGQELLVWGGIVPDPGAAKQTPVHSANDGFRLRP
jgi:hypothetical protein